MPKIRTSRKLLTEYRKGFRLQYLLFLQKMNFSLNIPPDKLPKKIPIGTDKRSVSAVK
jgi:hypothetical protein